MDKCKHGLDIERYCSECIGEAMRTMPAVSPTHQRMVDAAKVVFGTTEAPEDSTSKESQDNG